MLKLTRNSAWGLLLVAVLALCVLIWPRVFAESASPQGEHVAAPTITPEPASISTGVESTRILADPTLEHFDPPAPPNRESRIAIRGTVRVVDANGNHRPSTRGFVNWEISQPGVSTTMQTSPIELDAWSLLVAPESILRPLQLMWSSDVMSLHTLIADETIPATLANGYCLAATLEPGVTLNVLDKATSRHLDHVRLAMAKVVATPYRDTAHPPSVHEVDPSYRDVPSPLRLPSQPGIGVGWVGAPGYCWQRFAFVGAEGSISIRLAIGASLEVVVAGLPKSAVRPLVQLSRHEEGDDSPREVYAERPAREGVPIAFEGVPPGAWDVAVVPTPAARSWGPVLGQTRVLLDEDGSTHVSLDLRNDPSIRTTGSLHIVVGPVPSGDPIPTTSRVNVERVGRGFELPAEDYLASRKPEPDGTYLSRCPDLTPGRYVVSLVPQGLSREVMINPCEITQVHIPLSPPAAVALRVVRMPGELSGRGAQVFFRPAGSKSAAAWVEVPEPREGHVFEFRCHVGTVTITAIYPGHATVVEDLVVDRERVEHTVTLRKAAQIPITVQCSQSGTPILLPVDYWYDTRVEAVDPANARCFRIEPESKQVGGLSAFDAASARFHVNQPGLYRFWWPRKHGLTAIPPLEVDVRDGLPTARTITVDFSQ